MRLEESTTIPEIHETIVMLRELSADEKTREEAFLRERRLRDEISQMDGALRKGVRLGVKRGVVKALAGLVRDGILTLSEAAERAGMTVSEFNARVASLDDFYER